VSCRWHDDRDTTPHNLEATCQEFEMQLVAVQVKLRCGGDRNVGMGAAIIKMPKYEGSMSWTVFHRQFENVFDHTGGGGHASTHHFAGLNC
jgi:hypothetical protein